jgi:hypothetical protein
MMLTLGLSEQSVAAEFTLVEVVSFWDNFKWGDEQNFKLLADGQHLADVVIKSVAVFPPFDSKISKESRYVRFVPPSGELIKKEQYKNFYFWNDVFPEGKQIIFKDDGEIAGLLTELYKTSNGKQSYLMLMGRSTCPEKDFEIWVRATTKEKRLEAYEIVSYLAEKFESKACQK